MRCLAMTFGGFWTRHNGFASHLKILAILLTTNFEVTKQLIRQEFREELDCLCKDENTIDERR